MKSKISSRGVGIRGVGVSVARKEFKFINGEFN